MKARPVVLVVLTLIIGFVLGMLTSAQIRYQKLKPVRYFFSEERFKEGIYRDLNPDEKQKAKIDLVIEKYAKINGTLQDNFRKEFESNMKEFRKEIDANLTKEQAAKMKEMDERRQQMMRESRRNRGGDSARYRVDKHRFPEGRPTQDGPPPFHKPDSANLPRNK